MTDELIDNQNVKLTSETITNKQVTIAYFILVHRLPEQFKRLFKAIFHPENHHLIHLDKKISEGVYKDVKEFLSDFSNTSQFFS